MKNFFLIFALLFALSAHPAAACPTSQDVVFLPGEKQKIAQEVAQVFEAYAKGEISPYLKKVHPSAYAELGSKEAYRKLILDSQKEIKAAFGALPEVKSFAAREPSKIYQSNEEVICLVPTRSVVISHGIKMKVDGFVIAIKDEDRNWRYLEGGFHTEKTLRLLFPGLPDDLAVPEFQVIPKF